MVKIAICGLGKIGYAVALYFLGRSEVSSILLIDQNQQLLKQNFKKLSCFKKSQEISLLPLSVGSFFNKERLNEYDLLVAALPWQATKELVDFSLDIKKPLISVTRPDYNEIMDIKKKAKGHNLIMFGCGLEPGLTEIFAKQLAASFTKLKQMHIRCGGLSTPNPPLNYKKIFGNNLPLDMKDAYYIKNGFLKVIKRFSDIELINIEPMGALEAWHDGMLPWLIDIPNIKEAEFCTQKTLRWPGFAEKVNTLHELGFLSYNAINYEGNIILPRLISEQILRPLAHFDNKYDRDITILQIEAVGIINNKKIKKKLVLLDYYDESLMQTSMAKMSSYVLGHISLLVAKNPPKQLGLIRPEEYLQEDSFQELHSFLIHTGTKIIESEEECNT